MPYVIFRPQILFFTVKRYRTVKLNTVLYTDWHSPDVNILTIITGTTLKSTDPLFAHHCDLYTVFSVTQGFVVTDS